MKRRVLSQASRDPYAFKGRVTGDVRSGKLGYVRQSESDRHDVFWPFETEVCPTFQMQERRLIRAGAYHWRRHRRCVDCFLVEATQSEQRIPCDTCGESGDGNRMSFAPLKPFIILQFTKSATVLSAGGIRQQFSIPENVQMSLFTAEFLRNAGEWLRIGSEEVLLCFFSQRFSRSDNDPPHINFLPMPYVFLASTQEGADQLEKNWKMQWYYKIHIPVYNCHFTFAVNWAQKSQY